MDLKVVLIDVFLAIPLFFFLNYFDNGEKKDRMEINITHIVFPLVYMVLVSAIFSVFNWNFLSHNLFLVPIFECVLRTIYINRFLNQDNLMNHKYYYMIYTVTICLSYILYTGFISQVDSVLPDANEFRTFIWFLIILFFYISFKDRIHFDFLKEKATFQSKHQEYIVMNYAKLRNRFRDIVEVKENKDLVTLLYAIMVYENLLTPPAMRKLNSYVYRFTNQEVKSGIMQMKSKTYLTDQESITLSIKKLRKIMDKIKQDKKLKLTEDKKQEYILTKYKNKAEYTKNVLAIYHVIEEFEKRD